MLADEIGDVNGSVEWANDNQTVFYTRNDPQTLRSYQVKRHKLGTPVTDDAVAYEEQDEEFNLSIYKSRSREFIIIYSGQTLSTEIRLLRADDPDGEFVVFFPRQEKHEYEVDHLNGTFLIRSNEEAPNFRLFRASEQSWDRDSWQEVVPHREDTLLEGFDMFRDYLVLSERNNALTQLRIIANDGSADFLPAV